MLSLRSMPLSLGKIPKDIKLRGIGNQRLPTLRTLGEVRISRRGSDTACPPARETFVSHLRVFTLLHIHHISHITRSDMDSVLGISNFPITLDQYN